MGGTGEAGEWKSSSEVLCTTGVVVAFGSGLVTLMLASVSPSSFQEECCVVRGDSHGMARELGRAGHSGGGRAEKCS